MRVFREGADEVKGPKVDWPCVGLLSAVLSPGSRSAFRHVAEHEVRLLDTWGRCIKI